MPAGRQRAPSTGRLHAVVRRRLDNDWPSGDAYIKHISVPDVTTV
ncbi:MULTISPECIES: hypothetical protein [unclassified Streptomyces]|nr:MULTISPECIES: hypothetical protein [unclassified Streptomyces]